MGKYYNIGIFAHVDAGKTTITEQLQYACGALRLAGDVDKGTTQTDFLEIERRRGISVKTSYVRLSYEGNSINLIDTPGHADFAGEVERSMPALDGAVVVLSAVEGVQSHTRVIWRELKRNQMPTVFVINKIDRAGSNVEQVVQQIREELTEFVFTPERAENEGSDQCSVVSMNGVSDDLLMLLVQLFPEMEEKFLADETIPTEELLSKAGKAARQGQLFPVLYTSGKFSKGIAEVLEAVAAYLPAAKIHTDEAVSGLVFKVDYDRSLGKAAHVRLFKGTLKSRDTVPVYGRKNQPEKITQIRQFSGKKYTDTGVLTAGDIGAVYGLPSIRTGDVIGCKPLERQSRVAVPLLLVNVYAQKEEENPKLSAALREMDDEDPLIDFSMNHQTGEMYLKITGVMQIEVLRELLLERYNLEALFSKPSVIYKETPLSKGVGLERYTMPKPCWAVVQLETEPLPRGSGIVYESVIKDNVIPYRYQNHIETSVYRTLQQGIHGWEVTDARITLTGGEHHHVHTHPLDFFVATPVALLKALTNSGSGLLEPLQKVMLSADEALLGRIMGQMMDMRGTADSPVIKNGQFTMEVILPVAQALEYPVTFRSLTSGNGTYFSEFYGYQPCPEGLGRTMPRRGVDPLDRAKWILYARSAFQE